MDRSRRLSSDSSVGPIAAINFATDKFPCCIVWTPIPVLTWFFPFIGHMGIAMSSGVIRDFAGPYFVSEDNMAFGRPTRYLQLDPGLLAGGVVEWDECVSKASVVYGTRMHNLVLDNCHSHVAMALSLMKYNDYARWNMIVLALWMFVKGKHVSFKGALKTWTPFVVVFITCLLVAVYL
ncbi:transmembrane protein 222 [Sabethes cyaneus]|uniref:transmembrane protein 222 n=1 Tax=Sabethes cyaneus TaxID=53552 RepID=UPI00237E7207|nr:transmembrane protein 222 [Sabethes cyaneus]